jgi:hypothetical protein
MRSAALLADIMAAPRPCSARAATSRLAEGAAAHSADATMNSVRPAP